MTFAPRAAFGIPVYNHAHQLRRTLESILSQTFRDVGIVVVDDCSSDETPQILAEYAARDPRLQVVRNERRLGYTRNAMKAYRLARERFPTIEYFAWGSDHDLWHREWLRLLIEALDETPAAAVAWSWYHRIDGDGQIVSSRRDMLGRGVSKDVFTRVRYASSQAAAGSCLHGLMRVAALDQTSGLRLVLVPDRLMIAELATYGPFVEVPEFLWYRRYFGLVSRDRQRRSSFPDGPPAYSYLPLSLQHFLVLAQDYAVRRLAPGLSRATGLKLAYAYVKERRDSQQQKAARSDEVRGRRAAKRERVEAHRQHQKELERRRAERRARRRQKEEAKRRRREEALGGKLAPKTRWRRLVRRVRRSLGMARAQGGGSANR